MEFMAAKWWWSRVSIHHRDLPSTLRDIGEAMLTLIVLFSTPLWWPLLCLICGYKAIGHKIKWATMSADKRERAAKTLWRDYITQG